MTENKRTVEIYLEGFRRSDHQMVLSCLTDDVVWDIPGFVHLEGKSAFDSEIENPAFVGSPKIDVTRMIEEDDTVVAEGKVVAQKASGEAMSVVFCDVFEMRGGKIRRLTSYLMELK